MFDHISLSFSGENKTASRSKSDVVIRWLNVYAPDDWHNDSWYVAHSSEKSADMYKSAGRLTRVRVRVCQGIL